MLTPDRIAELRTRAWRLAGAGILVASVFVAFWVSELPGGFQTFSDAVGGGEGGAIGDLPEFLAMYAIAAAMIVALLALVPTGRSAITTWGTRTMYVYLLHGFVIRGFRATELSDVLASPAGVAIVIVAALALTVLLSSDAVVSRTRRLVEPDVGWLLRSEVDSHPLRGRQAGAASTAAGAANGAVEPAPAAAAQLGRAPLATAGSARSGS
jgi:fucose 4-O-acetylase-like acetyltransferase